MEIEEILNKYGKDYVQVKKQEENLDFKKFFGKNDFFKKTIHNIRRMSYEELQGRLVSISTVKPMADNLNESHILCACCECCCGNLAGLTRLDNPRCIARANYISQVDMEKCIGCETCLGRCKFGAISIDTVAKINIDKCVGCGLCAVTCPEEAITMKRLERETIPG